MKSLYHKNSYEDWKKFQIRMEKKKTVKSEN